MPINTPANKSAEAHAEAMRRENEREHSREARESFSDDLRAGFAARAQEHRARQEARYGFSSNAPRTSADQ